MQLLPVMLCFEKLLMNTHAANHRPRLWVGWLAAFCMAPFTPVAGQSVALPQVLDQATQQYPFLKAKQAEVSSAQRRLQASKTDLLPVVIVQDQYTYSTNNSLSGSFFPNEGTNISTSGGIRPENIHQGFFGSFTSAVIEWRAVTIRAGKSHDQRCTG